MTDEFQLSRRKTLAALGTIGAAGAAGGAATNALLWDEEKFGNLADPNVLQGGKLDLKVDWDVSYYNWLDDDGDGTVDEMGELPAEEFGSFPSGASSDGAVDAPGPLVQLTDLVPGDVVEHTLSLHLYDNPGYVSMAGDITLDSDAGITEPEDMVDDEVDDSDGDPFTAGLGVGAAGLLAGAVPGTVLGDDAADESSLPGRKPLRAAGAAAAGVAGLGALSGTAAAQTLSATNIATSGDTATDLAQSLVSGGGGITVNNASYTGADVSAGTFTGGESAIGIDSGIILSSGNVEDVEGPNESTNTTTDTGTPGDSDLDTLAGGDTFNAAILEFDFTVPDDAEQIFFNYVFGSEEYDEYVDSEFNDVFGFFLNPGSGSAEETNIAVIDDPDNPDEDNVAINNINNGENSDLYIDNRGSDGGTDAGLDTEMDGLTVVLDVGPEVEPGSTNTLKLAIADTGDAILDSWVLIEAESLTTEPPADDQGDGELDDLMECVVWYDGDDDGDDDSTDPGNNFPEEILVGDAYSAADRQAFVMDLTDGAVEFDETADAFLFRGTLRELFDALDDGILLSPGDDVPEAFSDSQCFDNSTTHYLGVLCWLPRDIPGYNDNLIQTDRVEYGFGFQAVQCRHNVGDGGPRNPFPGDSDATDD